MQTNEGLPVYNEVVLDQPFTFTPAAATIAEALLKVPYKWVTSFAIRLRSMGTATYVALGNQAAQEYRLTGVGQIYQFSCNPGEVTDLARIWTYSDTNDAVIEVVASYLPVALYGNVILAIGQR